MKIDRSGLEYLWEILLWLWCVMADQVNYPEDSPYDTTLDLWPSWGWGMQNAGTSDQKAPWNREFWMYFDHQNH